MQRPQYYEQTLDAPIVQHYPQVSYNPQPQLSEDPQRVPPPQQDEQAAYPTRPQNQDRDSGETLHNDDDIDQPKSSNDQEKNEQDPPLPVGFWHESLSAVRKQVITRWALTTLMLCTFILAVLSLYWAVLFNVPENMSALRVAVVNFDGQLPPYTGTEPLVGRVVEQAAQTQAQVPSGVIGYEIRSPAEFNNDPIAVRQAVFDEHFWAAIIVNNNATALLRQAVAQGNQSYDPLGAMQMVYVQARDEMTYANYIIPQLNEFAVNVQSQFGEQWIRTVLSDTSFTAATYSQAPQALSPAIGVSVFNLRPFNPPQATPAVTIGLIYLIIIAFFNFSFYLPIHSRFLSPQEHPPLHFYQLIFWRLVATTAAYFFLSLAYSLVSLAFQIPFSNDFPHNDTSVANNPDAYGKATFVVYWMLNFVGMYALGLASENVTMLIGQPWTALWLIFWVITNVSTSFYTIALAPRFFYWGWAWPLHQVVTASRTILFDTHSRIGLNFGILFAWCAVNTILFFPCAIYMRWKNNKDQARQAPRPTCVYLIDG